MNEGIEAVDAVSGGNECDEPHVEKIDEVREEDETGGEMRQPLESRMHDKI